jgi:hypothetical protein
MEMNPPPSARPAAPLTVSRPALLERGSDAAFRRLVNGLLALSTRHLALRDGHAARGAYLASKAAFLLSLVAAIALNPQRLFFLAIIVPAVLVLFVVYGLFSRWAAKSTGYPGVAAVANALAFGCFIAVTFPLVA